MSIIARPMLASAVEDVSKLQYSKTILASVKLDGIRALVIDGVLVSRSFKPIPNLHIRNMLSRPELEGLDGELIVGDTFQDSSSGVMSHDGSPDFTYYVFDCVSDSISEPFCKRLLHAQAICEKYPQFKLKLVEHVQVNSESELVAFETQVVEKGFEGIMVRTANSPYKCGRSSLKEGFLGKIKRHISEEYKVIGFTELLHNGNEQEEDAFGNSVRKTAKENMVGRNILGALVVESKDGVIFSCGTGFDAKLRDEIWKNRDKYLNKTVKIKSFLVGVKDKPRFPSFEGFRHEDDL